MTSYCMNNKGEKKCQIKKDVPVADATQQHANVIVAITDENYCPVCECDPCDCGWGSYIATDKR